MSTICYRRALYGQFRAGILGNLTGIVESVENGDFSVHIASGIKQIRVARKDDAQSTESTLRRCQPLKHLLHSTGSLIHGAQVVVGTLDVDELDRELDTVDSCSDAETLDDSCDDDEYRGSPETLSPLRSERQASTLTVQAPNAQRLWRRRGR